MAEGEELGSNLLRVAQSSLGGPGGSGSFGGSRKPLKQPYGSDGIPNGWVAVYLSDAGTQRFEYAPRVVELLWHDLRWPALQSAGASA